MKTARYRTALIVARNPRIRRRLPRITAYAVSIGLVLVPHPNA